MGLPSTPEDFTASWLTEALGERFPGIEVTELKMEEVHWGTATKVRMLATYAEDPGPDGPPAALCAKGGFDDRLSGYEIAQAYKIEASFYGEIAPNLDAPLPRSWYSGQSDEQGIVILDDLGAAGAVFPNPVEAWPADRVAAGLEVMAAWHGQTWKMDRSTYPWVTLGNVPVRAVTPIFLGDEHWEMMFGPDDALELPESLTDAARILKGFDALFALDDAGDTCLVHGDAHIGNTYLDGGSPRFLDWQSPCWGPPMDDAGYFITGALSPEDRRAHERDLLKGYLEALAAHGGPSVDADDAWLDYRRHALHGFLWALTPPVMQPKEVVRAMGERHVVAADELDALGALE